MKKLLNYLALIFTFLFFIWPTKIFAEINSLTKDIANPLNTTWGTLPSIVGRLFTIVVSAAGLIFIILFLVGGIQYLSSAGNEEGTGKAKKLLIDSVIGLIIVLSVWAIGKWIIDRLMSGI